MTIKNRFPDVAPVLNLDFANSKRLDPRITFTRASTGTYVDEFGIIRTAAANQARFDHDSAGNSLGLLIEEARTNYLKDGTGFTVTSGNGRTQPSNGTFSLTSVVNPTGSTGSTLFTTDVVSGVQISISGADYSLGNVGNSMSMFVKPNGITKIFLTTYSTAGNQGAYFELTGSGSVVGYQNNLPPENAFIEAYPNGWYRLGVRNSARIDYSLKVWEYDGGGNPQFSSVTGDGISGFYIWGWQNELGATFWSSCIPTSGSTVTRSADVASMTGTNFSSWYNQSEGTVFADITDLGYPLNTFGSLWKIFASTSHASGRNSINVTRYSGGALPEARFGIIDQNAVGQVDLVTSSPPTSARVKSAIGLQSGSYAASSHGNTVVTSSAAVPPTFVAADTLAFGQATNSTTQQKSCLVSRLAYYDRRLTDAQLQALTL